MTNDVFLSPLSNDINWLINGITKRSFCEGTHDNADDYKINLLNKLYSFIGDDDLKIVRCNQVHSDRIEIINRRRLEGNKKIIIIDGCDGLITELSGVLLVVLTADCVPVSFVDETLGITAVAHAGWKGTYEGICAKTIDKMITLGASPLNIKVWIGPAIGRCCYEISDELLADFKNRFANFKNISTLRNIDLKKINMLQAIDKGIDKDNIHVSSICTKCNSDNYFSYRKDPSCIGRIATFIGRKY